MSRKLRTKADREYQKKSDELDKVKIKCSKCGHREVVPVWVDKQICSWCGYYIYRNKKLEFEEKLAKTMKKMEKKI